MPYLDLQRLFADMGIDRPVAYLCKNGFTRHTAQRLVNRQTETIHFRHAEKLCTLLHCCPDDLFAWQPDPKQPLPAGHPLQKLRRPPQPVNLNDRLRRLPPEYLQQLRQFIDNLPRQD